MKRFCVFSFFFSFFGCPQHMEFPDQGSALSCSCDLYHSCGNARSFNQLCQAGDQTYMSWHCREAADPVVPQWQLHNEEFWVLMLGGKKKKIPMQRKASETIITCTNGRSLQEVYWYTLFFPSSTHGFTCPITPSAIYEVFRFYLFPY